MGVRNVSTGKAPGSQPFFTFEKEQGHGRGEYHQEDGKGVTPNFVQFGHKFKVHTVGTGNQCRRHENHRDNGENFYNPVLLHVNQTKKGVLQKFQTLEIKRGVIQKRAHILDHDPHVLIIFLREHLAFEHGRDDTLLLHDIFADGNGGFLEGGDLEQDFLVRILVHAHLTTDRGDLVGDVLDQVGIVVDAGLEDGKKDILSVHRFNCPQLAVGLGKRAKLMRPLGDENFILEDEGNRFVGKGIVLRDEEVEVDTDLIFGFHVLGTGFDLLALLLGEQFHPKIPLHLLYLVLGGIDQVDPKNIGTDGAVPALHHDHLVVEKKIIDHCNTPGSKWCLEDLRRPGLPTLCSRFQTPNDAQHSRKRYHSTDTSRKKSIVIIVMAPRFGKKPEIDHQGSRRTSPLTKGDETPGHHKLFLKS